MKIRSQKETTDLHTAFADIIELMDLSNYLADPPNDAISKLISRSSNSTCANLIEIIIYNKEVET